MTTANKSPAVIILTTDKKQREKLGRKLVEYQERMAFTAPEVNPHETYKRDILAALIAYEKVDREKERAEFSAYDWHNDRAFDDAYLVIAAYNSGDTSLVHGGTGLR